MRSYTRKELLDKLAEITSMIGKVPTQKELREFGISEDPYYREFGNWSSAKEEYLNEVASESALLKSDRIVTEAKNNVDKLLEQLKGNLSEEELKTLVKGTGVSTNTSRRIATDTRERGYFKCIATGDSHIGHKEFRDDWWDSMIERGIKEKVDFMYHTGDLVDGMSGRPGHVYELSEIGFEAQFGKLRQKMSEIPFQVRGIIGNHDLWYAGKADQGINIGERLAEACNNFVYLGAEEADDQVAGIIVKLWHGRDGSQYAYSYRTQRFIESIYGGTKPNILLAGHAHKCVFYESRNISVFETGTTCGQTGFMRHKKMAAHTGYWIIECWTNSSGVVRIRPEWNGFY